jgi:segregation and condensation protein B
MSDSSTLVQIVEAALLAAGKPLTVAQIGALFEERERPETSDIRAALDEVRERCDGRGYELTEVASGFRFQVRETLSPWVSRLWKERPQRYSRALLETLALIAYRQPITRGEIEEIRGVAVSTNIVKTLHERDWIRVVGHRDVPGRPAMYATTRQFLDYFNLKSLDQLPALADARDVETLNVELGFGERVAAATAGADLGPDGEGAASDADPGHASADGPDDDSDGPGSREPTLTVVEGGAADAGEQAEDSTGHGQS